MIITNGVIIIVIYCFIEYLVPTLYLDFPGGSDGKDPTCSVGDLGLIPGLERSPGGGHGNPLQYSCLENSHEQRNLAGCSSCGHEE